MNKKTLLRGMLASVCVVNLALGIICFASGPLAVRTGALLYGAALTEATPQTYYILRMMGCYLIAIGFMAFFAYKDPVKYKAIVLGNVLWLLLRALQRFIFAAEIHQAFQVSYARIWMNGLFVFIVAAILFFLRPKERS